MREFVVVWQPSADATWRVGQPRLTCDGDGDHAAPSGLQGTASEPVGGRGQSVNP